MNRAEVEAQIAQLEGQFVSQGEKHPRRVTLFKPAAGAQVFLSYGAGRDEDAVSGLHGYAGQEMHWELPSRAADTVVTSGITEEALRLVQWRVSTLLRFGAGGARRVSVTRVCGLG